MNDIKSGLVLDIDSGCCKILDGRLVDSAAYPCTKLEISFLCDEFILFEENNGKYYFRYCGVDWVPYQNKFFKSSVGKWTYMINAFPKTMYKQISTPATNGMILARAMDVNFNINSENLNLKTPLINLNAYSLIKYHRSVSFTDAFVKKDFGEAMFIYVSLNGLFMSTWSSIAKKTAEVIELDRLENENLEVSVIDNRILNRLSTPQVPRKWKESDYLNLMSGICYEYQIPKPVGFMKLYSMRFSDESILDFNKSLICSRVETNILDSSKNKCTFTEVNLYKEKKNI